MKKILSAMLIVIVSLMILVACSQWNSRYRESGDVWIIETVDTLASLATHVVRVEVLDSRTDILSTILREPATMDEELRNEVMEINTIHRLMVLEVFKGDVQIGNILEVAQPGGRQGNNELIYYGLQLFTYGDELIFFLRCFEEHGFGHWPMRLVAAGQSVYRVTQSSASGLNNLSGGIAAAYNANTEIADFTLECISSWNEIVLTVADLVLIRYEAGLGPRPHNHHPPVGVDRTRMNEVIAFATYLIPQNHNLPGWDNVQILFDEAVRVRDNPYSRQIHINHAGYDLWYAMMILGIDTDELASLPSGTNRDELHVAIVEAESREQQNYTPDSWSNLQHELEAAWLVYENQYATQGQLTEATERLLFAIEALEPCADAPTPTPPPGGGEPSQTGTVASAPWRLYPDGTLVIESGSITWNSPTSPWHSYSQDIHRVIIEGPITAGAQLQGLFSDLSLVYSIQGLDYINTSATTMMYALFRNASSLTSLDLSSWDTRNVINMGRMFMGANNLVHLNINGWDTSRVQRMHHMFQEANSLTSLDVSDWDTSRVITMHAMFTNVRGITQLEVSSWNTSNVTDMYGIFRGATGLTTLDLSGWDTGRVINMGRMFQESNLTSVGNISGWNTGSAQRMHHMFQDATSLTNGTVDVSNWNTANVFTMHGMFQGATGFTSLDLSRWDTRSLDNARSMFEGATGLTSLNLTGWQTGNVTITYGIFRGTSSLSSVQGISNWDMSNVTNMGRMFQDTNMTIDDISNWNTSSATAMHGLFQNAMGVTSLDLSGWSTHNITNMSFMFSGAPLQQLTLGQNFVFVNLPNGPALRAGTWSNVGGTYILSSAELMAHHNANPMQNTWTIN